MQIQQDLDRAFDVFNWNKYIMTALGLWPATRSDLRFCINYGYLSFLVVLEYMDLFVFLKDLDHVLLNLVENLTFSPLYVRISMLRLYNDELGEVIAEVTKDFDAKNYKTSEEKDAFIMYNSKSKIFVKLLSSFVAVTAVLYYVMPILVQLGSGIPEIQISENESQVIYILPFRFYVFYPIEDLRTYALTYASQFPYTVVASMALIAADCLMVTLVFHICGQLSVLALRISGINSDAQICREEMRNVVKMHVRLLRMGELIKEAFSMTLLAHLLGATGHICIIGYQILTNLDSGEKTMLVTFVLFEVSVMLVLYAQCAVGEYVLTESERVREAFYNCYWYDMPVETARYVILSMVRAQKPLCLTAGKFTTFCLRTLTEVIKTSMGYLSVLRTFM